MTFHRACASVLAVTGLVCGGANAQSPSIAYTVGDANLRAGPHNYYPVVTWLPNGSPVTLYGCTQGYTWCDVGDATGHERGWVSARLLSYPWQGYRVPIVGNGPLFGLPVVVFAPGPYWRRYYRHRPWYWQLPEWQRRPPGWRPPPGWHPDPVHPPGWVTPRHGARPAPRRPGPVRPAPSRPDGGTPSGTAPSSRP